MAVLANLNGKFVNPLMVESVEEDQIKVSGSTDEAIPRAYETIIPTVVVRMYSGHEITFEVTDKSPDAVQAVKLRIAEELSNAMNYTSWGA